MKWKELKGFVDDLSSEDLEKEVDVVTQKNIIDTLRHIIVPAKKEWEDKKVVRKPIVFDVETERINKKERIGLLIEDK